MKQIIRNISEFVTDGYGIYIMTGFFLIGFIASIVRCIYISHITNESLDIKHSKNNMIKHLWMKYEGFEKTQQHLYNTQNFVDKNIFNWKVCGLPVRLFTKTESMSEMLCIYCGIALGMYAYCGRAEIVKSIIYIGGGILMFLGLAIWKCILDIEDKSKYMRTSLVYSLECMSAKNGAVRVIGEKAALNEAKRTGKNKYSKNKNERKITTINEQSEGDSLSKGNNPVVNITYTKEEEEIIKEILDEFLA